MARITLPNLPPVIQVASTIPQASAKADAQRKRIEITDCGTSAAPGMFCSPDSPLLPRKPASF